MADRPANAFLRRLSDGAYSALSEHLEPLALAMGTRLHRAGDRVEFVYFPESALLSVLTTGHDGESVETATVGNEGGLGMLEAGASGISQFDSLVQVDGAALRVSAGVIRTLLRSNTEFAELAWSAVEVQMSESRQSGLCLARHSVEPRLARWLLESSERSGGRNPLPLTQEFLAAMLGVQRTTVTAFAAELHKAGLIRSMRGRIEIVDYEGLAKIACECREATREQRRELQLLPILTDTTNVVRAESRFSPSLGGGGRRRDPDVS